MAPRLEDFPVELLEQIALDLQHKYDGHMEKLRLTSRTIKAKVHRVFLLKFSRRWVPISPRKLLCLHKFVNYEDFGTGITRLFLVATDRPTCASEGYEPMLEAENSDPDIAAELQAIVASETKYAVRISEFVMRNSLLNHYLQGGRKFRCVYNAVSQLFPPNAKPPPHCVPY